MQTTLVHEIYLIKEQHLQGNVDWLVKDLKAWDRLYGWWAFGQFRAVSEQT
jgi:hypothetical protein